MKSTFTLFFVSLISAAPLLSSAQDVEGTMTFNTALPSNNGSFDFFIDASENIMVVSNVLGGLASSGGFSQVPLTMHAHNVFNFDGVTLAGMAPTYDFTGNESHPLGAAANDGFFWASTEFSVFQNTSMNHLFIGGTGLFSTQTSTDQATMHFMTFAANGGQSANAFGSSSQLEFTVLPEPSTALFSALSLMAGLLRRQR